jgi:hypothetical protein
MRTANIGTGTAVAVYLLVQFTGLNALGGEGATDHSRVAEPICTITDEAKCWSPTEVENALSLIFCGNGDESCTGPKLLKTGLHAEAAEEAPQPVVAKVRVPAPKPDEPKLDASGVPEFNAWEEGCD